MAKNKMLAVKMAEDTLSDFATVARSRGSTMSALVTQFVLKSIREEKAANPSAFADTEPHRTVGGESEIEQIIYETFEGRDVEPEKLRQIMKAIKPLLEIQEIARDQNTD